MLYFLLLAAAAAVVSVIVSNNLLTVSRYTVASDELPAGFDGFRIAHLSDLHSNEIGKNNSALIARLERESPDIIVMTGDMINRNDDDFTVFTDLCRELVKLCPVYYITGNHEDSQWGSARDGLLSQVSGIGVQVMNNTMLDITGNDGSIVLAGIDPGVWSYSGKSGLTMEELLNPDDITALAGANEPGRFTILLAHSPDFFPMYAEWGADLTLCGHIHGGMARFPFIGGIFSPGSFFFPKYDAGEYRSDDSVMILSRGLGIGVFGFRFNNTLDLVMVTLKSGS